MAETAPPPGGRLRAIVEALVFAAEEPLTIADLVDLFPGTDEEALQGALDAVAGSCESEERGLMVQRVAGGYRMATKPDLGEWVRALFRSRNRRRLSAQALETLAIIAYRQPITTPEIQTIRGTDPSSVLEALLEKRLVRILGRKKVVGKPFLYGTTPEFLAHFGLNSLRDLPDVSEFGALGATAGSSVSGSPVGPPAEGSPVALADRAATAVGGPFEEEEEEDGAGEGEDTQEDEDDENERGDDGDDS
jgi:segregation and condensation protein B